MSGVAADAPGVGNTAMKGMIGPKIVIAAPGAARHGQTSTPGMDASVRRAARHEFYPSKP